MKDQLEFELGDCYQSNLINEGNKLQREVEEVRERIKQVLTKEELEVLSNLVMNKLSPLQLAQTENNTILLALIK